MDKEKRSILSLRDITKTYVVENEVVEVVKNISFDVYDNEFCNSWSRALWEKCLI